MYAAGDVEDCLVQPLPQGQFTPLPETLCWVILDLTSSGQAAVLERIRSALQVAFPDMQRPSQEVLYDALARLTAERKVSEALPCWPRTILRRGRVPRVPRVFVLAQHQGGVVV
jgi:hypothetical protein